MRLADTVYRYIANMREHSRFRGDTGTSRRVSGTGGQAA
jgi:hypothetical protein